MSARRAFSKPFDWPSFWRTFPFQPVPLWITCTLLTRPLSRATPWLLRATCAGPARRGVADLAFLLLANSLPAVATALIYFGAGRRRIANDSHRRIGDGCLAIIVIVSGFNALSMARLVHSQWTTLGPGLSALRAACWPPRLD